MIALLYRDWLCLASASRADPIYTIQACIGLARIRLEEVDNGRGESIFPPNLALAFRSLWSIPMLISV
jgi:hypothetical protein